MTTIKKIIDNNWTHDVEWSVFNILYCMHKLNLMHAYMKHLETRLRYNQDEILMLPTISFWQLKIKGRNESNFDPDSPIPSLFGFSSLVDLVCALFLCWLASMQSCPCIWTDVLVGRILHLFVIIWSSNSLFFFQLNLHNLYFCSYLLLYAALQWLDMWNCSISMNVPILNLIIQFLLISTIVAPQNWN